MTELEVGYEVVDLSEKSELNVAPNASEASIQLRRSPDSCNEVFGSFGVDMKSATQIWSTASAGQSPGEIRTCRLCK